MGRPSGRLHGRKGGGLNWDHGALRGLDDEILGKIEEKFKA